MCGMSCVKLTNGERQSFEPCSSSFPAIQSPGRSKTNTCLEPSTSVRQCSKLDSRAGRCICRLVPSGSSSMMETQLILSHTKAEHGLMHHALSRRCPSLNVCRERCPHQLCASQGKTGGRADRILYSFVREASQWTCTLFRRNAFVCVPPIFERCSTASTSYERNNSCVLAHRYVFTCNLTDRWPLYLDR